MNRELRRLLPACAHTAWDEWTAAAMTAAGVGTYAALRAAVQAEVNALVAEAEERERGDAAPVIPINRDDAQ